MAAWRLCEGCGEVSVRFDPAEMPPHVVCASCAARGPCWVCHRLADDRCHTCQRWICVRHAHIRRQDWDHAWVDGIDLLCADHAVVLPGTAIDGPGI